MACPTFPLASRAENVTTVVPTGNAAGASFVITGDGSMVSVAVTPARNDATAGSVATMPSEVGARTLRSPGAATVGGVVSATVTWKEAEPVFPWPSVAVQVTEVGGPSAKRVPEAGAHDAAMSPLTASLAVGVV